MTTVNEHRHPKVEWGNSQAECTVGKPLDLWLDTCPFTPVVLLCSASKIQVSQVPCMSRVLADPAGCHYGRGKGEVEDQRVEEGVKP